jgi:hypothetical protein
VTGVAIADLLVGGIGFGSSGIAAGDIGDAFELNVGRVKTPETSTGKYKFLHGNLNFI